MAESAIKTEPEVQLGFNAPFIKHQRSNLRLTNGSSLRIMWAIKSTNRRILMSPSNGVAEPSARVDVQVLCEAHDAKPPSTDRLSIEWIECPAAHTGKNFDLKVLEAADVVHRKVLKLDYNM